MGADVGAQICRYPEDCEHVAGYRIEDDQKEIIMMSVFDIYIIVVDIAFLMTIGFILIISTLAVAAYIGAAFTARRDRVMLEEKEDK